MRFLRENILYISFGPFIGTSFLMEDAELSKAFFVTLSLWLKSPNGKYKFSPKYFKAIVFQRASSTYVAMGSIRQRKQMSDSHLFSLKEGNLSFTYTKITAKKIQLNVVR